MPNRRQLPIALTIAGSDSGGGAGIQADLKTFAALGVHGTTAVTCITAQNPNQVIAQQACESRVLSAQLAAIFAELPPAAVKTGMLHSVDIVRQAAYCLSHWIKKRPLIVDPVMVSTSGAPLLEPEAVECLREELLPLATLITPNLDEAKALCGIPIIEPEDLRTAARLLRQQFRCAVLIKGGHLPDAKDAVDIFYDGKTELLLSAPFIKGVRTHGTGCTYSAAIAAYCALGWGLSDAVTRAKTYVTQAIAQCQRVAGHDVLNHFWSVS